MQWTTEVEFPKSGIRMDWKTNLAFIGSCFAEKMAEKFTRFKFHTWVNPFGIVYNPLSVANMLERISNQKFYSEKEIFSDGEVFYSWDFHGKFSSKDPERCLQQMNAAIQMAHGYLKTADVVFITLGTAYCYFLKESGAVVSNCHRQNGELFNRELVSVERVSQALQTAVSNLERLNPQVRIVLTVSPLRHLRDGAHGNQLSKATLLLAVQQTVKNFSNVEYFPSYEIVMDELRDYRFYAADMVHLSPVAEDYIFEKCGQAYFDFAVCENLQKLDAFLKSAEHRIVDADASRLRAFAEKSLATAKRLEAEIEGLDLASEIRHFASCL